MKPARRSKSGSGVERRRTTEQALIADLNEDLLEAWDKLKHFARGLGELRMYASGRSIIFSKKCPSFL